MAMLMPSPTGPGLSSAFSPYTDSPSSPANFNQVFSNRCRRPAPQRPHRHILMESQRSSGAHSDHLIPPPSPYPATVDPSPVDSNGTSATDHTEVYTAGHYDIQKTSGADACRSTRMPRTTCMTSSPRTPRSLSARRVSLANPRYGARCGDLHCDLH